MNIKQQTIQKEVSISGVGLHTGALVTLTFCPAPAHHGYKFQRVDLEGQPIIEADVDNVVDTSRGTTIAKNGAKIHTVEHTLAALVGLQIDNVLIKVDAPEPPILDGSSYQFIQLLEEAGIEEQNALRNYFEISEEIYYRDKENGVEIVALPAHEYRLTVLIDFSSKYNAKVLPSQHASLNDLTLFKDQISRCRTFCFLTELENLYKNGLIKGGDLSNAIVFIDKETVEIEELEQLSKILNKPQISINIREGILNNLDLHYVNEPARHKLLDLIGDLSLAGRPIKGQIMAARSGHKANVAFARLLKKKIREQSNKDTVLYDPKASTLYDVNEIAKFLPHRYPFQLVDKIIHLDSESVIGVKNVTINEHFFMGHFPNNPVMPGVLQIEALAQTGGILVLSAVADPENYWPYLVGIENCRFRKSVQPGDILMLKCTVVSPLKRGIIRMRGGAYVNGHLVCEAEMIASLVKKNK